MSRNEYYKESIWKFIKEKESKHSNPTQIKHLGSPLTTNNNISGKQWDIPVFGDILLKASIIIVTIYPYLIHRSYYLKHETNESFSTRQGQVALNSISMKDTTPYK